MAKFKIKGQLSTKAKLCVMLYAIAIGLMVWLIFKPTSTNQAYENEIKKYELEAKVNTN
jgi:hypothetical protein